MACVNVNNRFNALSKSNAAMKLRLAAACLAAFACSLPVVAEDGYDLWLRYHADTQANRTIEPSVQELVEGTESPTLDAAESELLRGLSGLTGRQIPLVKNVSRSGAVVFGTPRSSTLIAELPLSMSVAGR